MTQHPDPTTLVPHSDAVDLRSEAPALSREDIIGICLKMLELRESGDWATLAEYLTEDCEMEIPGIPGVSPFAGKHKGRKDCISALRSNFTLIEPLDVTALNFVVDGDCVSITWTSGMRNRGTGPRCEVHGVIRFRFRGRRACYYSNHFDTAAVAALAGIFKKEI